MAAHRHGDETRPFRRVRLSRVSRRSGDLFSSQQRARSRVLASERRDAGVVCRGDGREGAAGEHGEAARQAWIARMSAPAGSSANVAGWELFPHGADVGVRGWGATPAQALTAVITESEVQPLLAIEVECAAPDLELLFVEWLNAVIYEMAVRDMLFRRFLVRIDGVRLAAKLWGEPIDVERHAPACE